MQKLRGKVTFNYDLRKRLSPGQKANIRKAFNKAKEYGITKTTAKAHFIKIPRKPKESYTKYKRRVKEIKENIGQSGSQFLGVYVDSPVNLKDVHYSFKDNKLAITRSKFGYSEAWESIDTEKFVTQGWTSIKQMVDYYTGLGYSRMSFVSNGAYRYSESIKLPVSDEFMISKINFMLSEYGDPTDTQYLTGILFMKHAH